MTTEHANLMRQIYELGFALTDTILYLDTHPTDQDALEYYETMQERYKEVRKEHNRLFGPLLATNVIIPTVDCKKRWIWNDSPMPWEGGCN